MLHTLEKEPNSTRQICIQVFKPFEFIGVQIMRFGLVWYKAWSLSKIQVWVQFHILINTHVLEIVLSGTSGQVPL